jgi:sugar O-acyltransferase (sialic acid O-acetyltransferase NeuD family)
MKAPLLLVGGGGHCRSCIDVIEAGSRFGVAGIVERPGTASLNGIEYPLLGSDDDLPRLLAQYPSALVTVGQIKDWQLRVELFDRLKTIGAALPVVVSPHAYCSPRADIGSGTIVMHSALINTQVRVGENCIINSQALIEHDAVVGAHCHISTGAKLNGAVHVEEGCFIGSGAVIREGVRIGARCIVGAGAVVLHDVPAGTTLRRCQ